MIFHITTAGAWTAAQKEGTYHHESLETEGFIHCSQRDQLVETANLVFRGQTGLVILCIDRHKVGAPVQDDPAPARGDSFPHIYGRLNLDAVVAVVAFAPNAAGEFTLPPDLPAA